MCQSVQRQIQITCACCTTNKDRVKTDLLLDDIKQDCLEDRLEESDYKKDTVKVKASQILLCIIHEVVLSILSLHMEKAVKRGCRMLVSPCFLS